MISLAKRVYERLVDGRYPQGVVFHHVPKCGGTSTSRSLRQHYWLSQASIRTIEAFRATQALRPGSPFEDLWRRNYDFRQHLLLYMLMKNVRCITAHVEFSEAAYDIFRDRYVFVTVLRDPVERFLSQYFFSYQRDTPFGIFEPLNEFIHTNRGHYFGRIYSTYFSGLPPTANYGSSEAVERAKANLDRFSAVGFIADMAQFGDKLSQLLDRNIRIGRSNRAWAPQSLKDEMMSPKTLEQLREICAPDLEIYDYARRKFDTHEPAALVSRRRDKVPERAGSISD